MEEEEDEDHGEGSVFTQDNRDHSTGYQGETVNVIGEGDVAGENNAFAGENIVFIVFVFVFVCVCVCGVCVCVLCVCVWCLCVCV